MGLPFRNIKTVRNEEEKKRNFKKSIDKSWKLRKPGE